MNISFYNKSQLKERGWTPAAISRFLGKPDTTTRSRRNRRQRIQLFDTLRVEQAENTAAWKEWKKGSLARSAALKKSAAVKRQATLDKAASRLHTITLRDDVVGLSPARLQKLANEHFLHREQERELRSGGRYIAETITDRRSQGFLDRIAVNWLRHEGTVYDRELDEYFANIGVNQAKDMVREHVYALIAAAYPHLAGECDRQLGVRRAKSARTLKMDVSSRSAIV